ncbi:hypothetical protein OESDEN_00498 [Oesophagostomum dentatum]|uniref:Chitinase domain-containing protein 1 n=1 Tax=Oesophagostomum dentatum TaxID=61180 RepID=A0A0B1TUI3_OESDE|nr:hypothetical protein OESDEN_00498 [Oesophagostomum dentatum]
MVQTGGETVEMLLEMLLSWGHAFRKQNLQIILPVGPPLGPDNRPTGMFTTGHFLILSQNIDYIQIMTYDYSVGDKQGVAPYDWVERSVEAVISRAKDYSGQLMVGINHYGYEYSSKSIQALNFDKYLELLKKDENKLEWDPNSKEHYLVTGSSKVYYPSLTSIEMRLNIARKYKTGAAIWDFGQGLNYFTQLL